MDRELVKLQVENDMLREALQKAEEREIRLLDTIRMIEHKPVDPTPPVAPDPVKRSWWRRLFSR